MDALNKNLVEIKESINSNSINLTLNKNDDSIRRLSSSDFINDEKYDLMKQITQKMNEINEKDRKIHELEIANERLSNKNLI